MNKILPANSVPNLLKVIAIIGSRLFRAKVNSSFSSMKMVPPLPGEESLYDMMQSVLDAAAKDPAIKDTLVQTAIAAEKDLISPFFAFHNNGRPVGNG